MARLFELSQEFAAICDQMDEVAEDDTLSLDKRGQKLNELFCELDKIDGDMKEKVLNLAGYCKDLEMEEKALKLYERKTREKIASRRNRIDRLKTYIKQCLEIAGVKRVEDAESCVMLRSNPPSVQIKDESAFIRELEDRNYDDALEYYEPKIKKSVVKDYLKDGYEFENAQLQATTSVLIG